MKTRYALLAAAALAIGACADVTTAPPASAPSIAQSPEVLEARRSGTATLTGEVDQLLPDGSRLVGVIKVSQLSHDAGQLYMSGMLTGQVTKVDGTVLPVAQALSNVAVDLTEGTIGTMSHTGGGFGRCDILNLDLGPLFLDVLGLQIDLAPVVLDIVAQAGSGNLLGNLLCAVVGLLDGPGLLAAISGLLQQINTLLGAL